MSAVHCAAGWVPAFVPCHLERSERSLAYTRGAVGWMRSQRCFASRSMTGFWMGGWRPGALRDSWELPEIEGVKRDASRLGALVPCHRERSERSLADTRDGAVRVRSQRCFASLSMTGFWMGGWRPGALRDSWELPAIEGVKRVAAELGALGSCHLERSERSLAYTRDSVVRVRSQRCFASLSMTGFWMGGWRPGALRDSWELPAIEGVKRVAAELGALVPCHLERSERSLAYTRGAVGWMRSQRCFALLPMTSSSVARNPTRKPRLGRSLALRMPVFGWRAGAPANWAAS